MKSLLRKGFRKIGNAMFEREDPQDLKKELARHAAQKTAEYIRDNMRAVQSFEDIYAVHDFALANATLTQGLFLEFGVYSGKTINYIAS